MSIKTIIYLGIRPFTPKKHGIRGVILHTVLVVAVAMLPLSVVLMVADGMIQGITNRYIETSSYHFRVYSRQPAEVIDFEEYEETKARILSLSNIKSVSIERNGAGLGVSTSLKEGVQIRGVDPDLLKTDKEMNHFIDIVDGEFDLNDSKSIVLSSSLARKMDVNVGDDYRLITGKVLSNGRILPKISKMSITGIIKTGYEDLDRLWVFIPYSNSVKILPNSSSDTFIGIKCSEPYGNLDKIYQEIKSELPSGWVIRNWRQLNRNTYENFKTTKMVLSLIMGLIVLVAAINISSSLIMLVLEKRRDIAILKGMGLSPQEVMGSYLFTGVIIGIIGTLLGVILGIYISININEIIAFFEKSINIVFVGFNYLLNRSEGAKFILLDSSYYLDDIPVDVDITKLSLMTFFSIITTSMASYFPARRAGLIKPLTIMQKY
ncbi:MAG: hypothetical protein B6229_03495 [Spirochaetaceae bacterium 4572_7]|nr:MAG: hypothetical protein B6229_03495 [Spirochaetaceae bacterium 4572_7]